MTLMGTDEQRSGAASPSPTSAPAAALEVNVWKGTGSTANPGIVLHDDNATNALDVQALRIVQLGEAFFLSGYLVARNGYVPLGGGPGFSFPEAALPVDSAVENCRGVGVVYDPASSAPKSPYTTFPAVVEWGKQLEAIEGLFGNAYLDLSASGLDFSQPNEDGDGNDTRLLAYCYFERTFFPALTAFYE